jgi:hypothetical protein
MIAERPAAQRSASQLASDLRTAEAKLLEAQSTNSAARSRLPHLLHSGDQLAVADCKREISQSNALVAELTEEAEFFRAAIKEAEAHEIEAATVRSYELIRRKVNEAAEATVTLHEMIAQFGAAITEWNAAVSAANDALQNNGIAPLRDHLALGTILNLIDLNLYAITGGVIGKKLTIDSLDQLREKITKGDALASLPAAAATYKTLTLRHARLRLNLSRPEVA